MIRPLKHVCNGLARSADEVQTGHRNNTTGQRDSEHRWSSNLEIDSVSKFNETLKYPLESRGNYSATSNNIKLVHLPLMGGLLRLVQ